MTAIDFYNMLAEAGEKELVVDDVETSFQREEN